MKTAKKASSAKSAKAKTRPRHDPLAPLFTRAQVEWALWRALNPAANRNPPRAFKIAVKHFLEFDRTYAAKNERAFSDDPPAGRGDHGRFSVFDAFMLHSGLNLLTFSFKRKEVVLMLRDIRAWLRREMKPLLTDQFNLTPGRGSNRQKAQTTLILSYDFTKPFAQKRQLPSPIITDNFQATMAAINAWGQYNLVIMDLRESALSLPLLLKQAPKARRGRSRA